MIGLGHQIKNRVSLFKLNKRKKDRKTLCIERKALNNKQPYAVFDFL